MLARHDRFMTIIAPCQAEWRPGQKRGNKKNESDYIDGDFSILCYRYYLRGNTIKGQIMKHSDTKPGILRLEKNRKSRNEIAALYDEYFRIRGQIKKARNCLKALVVIGAGYSVFLTFAILKTI